MNYNPQRMVELISENILLKQVVAEKDKRIAKLEEANKIHISIKPIEIELKGKDGA